MAIRAFRQRKPPVDRTFKVVRITGMYGACKCIKAYIGNQVVGDSHYDAVNRVWLLDYTKPDGALIETQLPCGDDFNSSMEEVEFIFTQSYLQHHSALAEVA